MTIDDAEGEDFDSFATDAEDLENVSCEADHMPEDAAEQMGFVRFIPPPFITRHTPPWVGRDDDPKVIEKVLDDFITMTDAQDDFCILGVDQKIGACHMKLEHGHPRFKKLIREIPVLHLLKMEIVNLCSAYKTAGLLHVLKFMRDE